MSKAARLREQSARERIAAQQAAAKRSEARRRMIVVATSVLAVIAVAVALVITYNLRSKTPASSATGRGGSYGTVLPASVVSDVTGVPAATLESVGSGSVPSYANSTYSPPPLNPISGSPPLVSNGKPEMLYIGAEFCPYCAAMRWAMAVALSRFGHFTTQLHGIHSSSSDVYPSTPTLTFYKAGYTSPYFVFTPVENETITHAPLQNTTASQQALWQKYDSSDGSVGYPFIDFGNKVVIKAPLYSPGVLSGLSWAQVASQLSNPSSQVAKAIDGTANYISAAICKMTGNADSAVCSSSAVSKLEAGI
jgi:hypothetical protein